MEQIDTDALKTRLIQRKGRWREISDRSGMSYSWLSKFAGDRIPNPGVRSLRKLESALKDEREAA